MPHLALISIWTIFFKASSELSDSYESALTDIEPIMLEAELAADETTRTSPRRSAVVALSPGNMSFASVASPAEVIRMVEHPSAPLAQSSPPAPRVRASKHGDAIDFVDSGAGGDINDLVDLLPQQSVRGQFRF